MYCIKCGYEVREDALFCPCCGAKLEHEEAPAAPIEEPAAPVAAEAPASASETPAAEIPSSGAIITADAPSAESSEEAPADSAPTKEENALARSALILSIISLALPVYSGGIISCIVGLILSAISKTKLREYLEMNAPSSGKTKAAKTLSTVAIIVNIVTIVTMILLLIALIVFCSLVFTYILQQGGGEVVIDEANGIIATIPEEWLQIFR